ncbi:MAG: hypothetical protein OXB92_14520 [Acidimicrobiaceae bacterium]|nr:hypothetical protein [Acidimicrobiia bacterium]MCY4495060.1 hypothetical protein [Acidimicrobiaceae bacterium]
MSEKSDIDPARTPPSGGPTDGNAIDASEVESMDFPVTRRGLDPSEVRARLQLAGAEIRRLQRLCDELTGTLTEISEAGHGSSDARRVTEMLGVEVSAVLEAAHEAATSTIQRAESEAEAMSQQARAAAESVLADATAQSSELVEAARLDADKIVEEGRSLGREMVQEAQTVRERILRDLARKRQAGRTQIEQLRAGRDRLLEALTTVQGNLDAAVEDLVSSVPEARAAANRAGLRVSSEPVPSVDVLEAEIEAGRLVDHPLVSASPLPGPIDDTFTTGEMEALDHLDALSPASGETDPDDPDAGVINESESTGSTPEPEAVARESEQPVQPTDPAASVEPAVAAEPAEPAQPAEPGQPDETVQTTELGRIDLDAEADSTSGIETGTEPDRVAGAVAETARDDPGDRARDAFARLRRASASAVPREEPQSRASRDTGTVAEPPRTSPSEGPEAPGGPGPDDGLRERAAAAAAKSLKRVLVEEQGLLLDGVRRIGAGAVALLQAEEGRIPRYDQAAIPALREQCIALGGAADLDLAPALANIHVIALDPVRRRLADIAEQLDSEEELSDAVRALYREARSRHMNEAAAAASVAVDGLVKINRAHADKVDPTVRWVVDPGGSCGADCADNALAGEVAAGEKFPTGDRFPPAHPGCRCRLEVA